MKVVACRETEYRGKDDERQPVKRRKLKYVGNN